MTDKNKEITKQQMWLKKHEEELVRAELNLCKLLSIWDTSKTKRKSKIIEQKIILPNGDVETKRITIGRIEKNEAGIFTIKKHFKTLLALIRLYEKAGKPDGKVNFGVHQLAEELNLKWGSTTYKYLKEALEGLRAIPIKLENAFYNKKTGETEEFIDYFTWLEELRLYGKLKDRQPNFSISSFTFNKYIRQNILDNYTKPLFFKTIIDFKSDISILLYNHLDLIMADKSYYERNLKNLIEIDFKLDGVYEYSAHRKILFKKPLKELKGVKLSTGILADIKLEKTKDGKDYKIVCRKKAPVLTEKQIEVPQNSTEPLQTASNLVKYFHSYTDPNTENYTPSSKEIKQAETLIAEHGEEKTKHIIEFAVKKAKETNFDMQWFGAVLNYTSKAIGKMEQNAGHIREEENRQLECDYEFFRMDESEKYKTSLQQDELKKISLQHEKIFLEKHRFYQTFSEEKKQNSKIYKDTLTSFFNDWLITEGIVKPLTFEAWKAQSTDSREKTETTTA